MWFRQDLRLHDNEALRDALEVSNEVIPIYVFDERVFNTTTPFGFKKTDKFRAKFIIESVENLRKSLRKKGSELIVRIGKPEEEVYKIAKAAKTNWVFCNRERTQEEVDVQDALEKALWSIGQEIRYSRGKMLYYTQDLPFPVSHTPDSFSSFRKEVEKFVSIREPFLPPNSIPSFTSDINLGTIPTLEDLGHSSFEIDKRASFVFEGGEDKALQRLHSYLWETKNILRYKEIKNNLLEEPFSSKLSPWISQGCLSPKKLFYELKKFEKEHKANKSTYWLFFELMWRDFFRLMGKKHGNCIFKKGGIKKENSLHLKDDYRIFELWQKGRTGIPFIDANMKELNATGYISNRGRLNVASFLIQDLKVNWQMGAEYFESILIDYDPCSNWGNWNQLAGVGSDSKEMKYYNIISQAKRYDPHGDYVKHWLPELERIPKERIHIPDTLSLGEQKEANFVLGADYPKAMLNTNRWTR